jgi:hypothetical protein
MISTTIIQIALSPLSIAHRMGEGGVVRRERVAAGCGGVCFLFRNRKS